MRIAIVGAGALGSLLAALLVVARRLSGIHAEVWLIGAASSGAHLQAIDAGGLWVEVDPRVAAAVPAAVVDGLRAPVRDIRLTQDAHVAYRCALAIVLVKSYRTESAAQQVAHLLAPDGLALSLQNGLGNTEILARHVGAERVTQGTTLLAANLRATGRVHWAGVDTTSLAVAPTMGEGHRRTLVALKSLLDQIGAPVILTPDIQSTIWTKLAVNCAINPAAALLDVANGVLLEHEATRRLMADVVGEVVQVAHAAGITLPLDEEAMVAQALHVAAVTATNAGSMVQDLRRGRPTEIEALNGAVVRIADALGLPAPVNRTLANLIRARQNMS